MIFGAGHSGGQVGLHKKELLAVVVADLAIADIMILVHFDLKESIALKDDSSLSI